MGFELATILFVTIFLVTSRVSLSSNSIEDIARNSRGPVKGESPPSPWHQRLRCGVLRQPLFPSTRTHSHNVVAVQPRRGTHGHRQRLQRELRGRRRLGSKKKAPTPTPKKSPPPSPKKAPPPPPQKTSPPPPKNAPPPTPMKVPPPPPNKAPTPAPRLPPAPAPTPTPVSALAQAPPPPTTPVAGYAPAPSPSQYAPTLSPPVLSENKKDCIRRCDIRCLFHPKIKVCNRACMVCCDRCKCVPPGPFSRNREMCGSCYTQVINKLGYIYKCP